MAHIRAQVRTAVLAALTGLATTGANAFVARERALLDAELPCVLISVSDTAVADSLSAPQFLRRLVLIDVQAVDKSTTGVIDTLDQIGAEVETALGNGLTVDGETLYPRYTGSAPTDLSGEIDRPVAALSLTFELEFYTVANAPAAIA